MGQRLNIEIHENGKCLANAYYHWSGYTESALDFTKCIINKFYQVNKTGLAAAIKLLQFTGAKVECDELVDAGLPTELALVFSEGVNRNDGLIAFSEKRMEETRYWEEGRVTIDIGTEIINFDCWEKYYEGLSLEVVNVPYQYHAIPFSDFSDFLTYFDDPCDKKYVFIDGAECTAIY